MGAVVTHDPEKPIDRVELELLARKECCGEHCAGRLVFLAGSALFMCGPCRKTIALPRKESAG